MIEVYKLKYKDIAEKWLNGMQLNPLEKIYLNMGIPRSEASEVQRRELLNDLIVWSIAKNSIIKD